MMNRILLVLLLVVLSGCPARNVAHDPEKMSPFTSDQCFVVDTPLLYSERRGIGILWEQGVRPGVYKPALQDANGYFFLGPDDAICQGNPKCEEFGAGLGGDGGLWVSKTSDDDIRLFAVFEVRDGDKHKYKEAGVLIYSLINQDHGKMFIFDRNEEFVDEIAKTRVACPDT